MDRVFPIAKWIKSEHIARRFGFVHAFAVLLALRVWGSWTFAADVDAHTGHRLVESDPHRLVRHPPSTGVLPSFVGRAVRMGKWFSASVLHLEITGGAAPLKLAERLLTQLPVQYQE